MPLVASPAAHRGRRPRFPLVLALLAALVLLVSCRDGAAETPPGSAAPPPTAQAPEEPPAGKSDKGEKGEKGDEGTKGEKKKDNAAGAEDVEDGGGTGKDCPAPGDRPTLPTDEVDAVVLADGAQGPRVVAAVYPVPDYEGKPWSQWGQGAAVDGRFVSAVGDHCGVNGDSYFYDYDVAAARLRPAGDVLSLVDHAPGAWGYGKVHAQMVATGDGTTYVTTYWGTKEGLAYGEGYEGDLLLRRDPASGQWTSMGVPLPGYGIPSLAGSAEDNLLYGEAVEPVDFKKGVFFVYDLQAGEVIFQMDKGDTKGYRSVLVDAEGRAYFSTGAGQLHVYDPETNEARPSPARLPGEWLRAATAPAPDGTVYGVTRDPDTLFALRPSGEIDDLGPVRGYVASLALSPDGTQLFYVPDAHGTSWEQGTPLIAVDTSSGEESVVMELNELAEERLGLRLGGSYNVVMDPDGERLYIGLNAEAPETGNTFGQVVLAVVELP